MSIIIYTIISLIVGIGIGFMIFRFVIKSKYNKMMSEAANDAEVLKQKKLLEVKEEFLNKKAQLEKEGDIESDTYREISAEIEEMSETYTEAKE